MRHLCNKCLSTINKFIFILNCHHIFCEACANRTTDTCLFCKNTITTKKILLPNKNISLVGLGTIFISQLLEEYFTFQQTQQAFNIKIRNRKIVKIENMIQKLLFYIENIENQYRDKEQLLLNNIEMKERVLKEQFNDEWDEYDDTTLIK